MHRPLYTRAAGFLGQGRWSRSYFRVAQRRPLHARQRAGHHDLVTGVPISGTFISGLTSTTAHAAIDDRPSLPGQDLARAVDALRIGFVEPKGYECPVRERPADRKGQARPGRGRHSEATHDRARSRSGNRRIDRSFADLGVQPANPVQICTSSWVERPSSTATVGPRGRRD